MLLPTDGEGGGLQIGPRSRRIPWSLAFEMPTVSRERSKYCLLLGAKAQRQVWIGGRPRSLEENQVKAAQAMQSSRSLAQLVEHFGVGKAAVYRALRVSVNGS